MTHQVAQPLPMLPEWEVDAARAAYLAALKRFPGEVSEAGKRLLARIDGANWAAEWSLPYWLGETFGLRREATRTLTLANVFGLAYVRLQDDVIDGELAREEQAGARLLTTALYQLWLDQYRKLFAPTSPFWRYFDSYLSAWMRGTLRDGTVEVERGNGTDVSVEHALELAERGAPLKLGGVGACLLAFRTEDVAAVEAAVDHLLGAAVLLDHAHDWREDLAARRYNAFVAYAIGQRAQGNGTADAQRAVLEEVFIGDAGRPYFALVHELIARARREARPLACGGLDNYLDGLGEMASSYRARLARHAERTLRAAVARFLYAGATVSHRS